MKLFVFFIYFCFGTAQGAVIMEARRSLHAGSPSFIYIPQPEIPSNENDVYDIDFAGLGTFDKTVRPDYGPTGGHGFGTAAQQSNIQNDSFEIKSMTLGFYGGEGFPYPEYQLWSLQGKISAESSFYVKFKITEPSTYTFSGSFKSFGSIFSYEDITRTTVRLTGSGNTENLLIFSNDEPFLFNGVLLPGEYSFNLDLKNKADPYFVVDYTLRAGVSLTDALFTIKSVPEPAGTCLMLLLPLAFMARRKRTRQCLCKE